MQLDKVRSRTTDQFFEAVLTLENKEECYAFFDDLCTVSEMKAIALRLEVARRLASGGTYLDISFETNKSSAVISRIKNCLYYGSGGYKMILERLEKLIGTDDES